MQKKRQAVQLGRRFEQGTNFDRLPAEGRKEIRSFGRPEFERRASLLQLRSHSFLEHLQESGGSHIQHPALEAGRNGQILGQGAGAVLRGYVEHQRERLGDRAATNPNFQNVSAALHALEAQVGPSARA